MSCGAPRGNRTDCLKVNGVSPEPLKGNAPAQQNNYVRVHATQARKKKKNLFKRSVGFAAALRRFGALRSHGRAPAVAVLVACAVPLSCRRSLRWAVIQGGSRCFCLFPHTLCFVLA